MSVRFEYTEKELTAYLSGEIDHHTAAEIRESIDNFAQTYRPKVLKLDFNDVTFMDSSGVGLVMGRIRTMDMLDGRVEVLNLSSTSYRVMVLANLEKHAVIKQREVSEK